MSKVSYTVDGSQKFPVKFWTKNIIVEEKAIEQVKNIANMPFIYKHVAVMPDCHLGKGATVGSVIATKGAIIPAAVGVDIGCGMLAVKLNISANQLPDNLFEIRTAIENAVPHGRTNNGGPGDRGAWFNIPEYSTAIWNNNNLDTIKTVLEKHPKLERAVAKAPHHLGTLGTGNHFVELCLDEENSVWVMLHSGSRGIGNALASRFIELAKEDMRRYFINLPDMDLAYIPEGSVYFDDYVNALQWANKFAILNREIMLRNILIAIYKTLDIDLDDSNVNHYSDMAINCHHNYVTKENHFGENIWITRKGAVSARKDQLGIIPGSMGAKSFIVRGKGNPDSFCSTCHGAGRAMSRTQARKTFTLEDHIEATKGVECRKDIDVIDETPKAYKDIDLVMEAASDLVEIVHTLKQIVCVKG